MSDPSQSILRPRYTHDEPTRSTESQQLYDNPNINGSGTGNDGSTPMGVPSQPVLRPRYTPDEPTRSSESQQLYDGPTVGSGNSSDIARRVRRPGTPRSTQPQRPHGNYDSTDSRRVDSRGGGNNESPADTAAKAPNNRASGERPLDFLHFFGLIRRLWPANDDLTCIGNVSYAVLNVLGTGLSFTVSICAIKPPLQQFFAERIGWPIGDKMVIKRMRYTNDEIQELSRENLYRACLREIRALTHPPLVEHPNIMRLLGVMWEPDPNHHDTAWPMLLLEYAEEGTLKDYQMGHRMLGYTEKARLCEDVARGLLALHGSWIVHGDLKSENVLVFACPKRERMVAKLADFGSSVLDYDVRETMLLPAYSIPWNAPEYQKLIARDHLKFADVYSFGMLVFRTMIDGINPFKVPPFKVDGVNMEARSQQMKTDPDFRSRVASVMVERCREDVEVGDVCAILEVTLVLDPPTERDLEAAVMMLCAITQNEDPVAQGHPLQDFEYEEITFDLSCIKTDPMCVQLSSVRALEAIANGDSPRWQEASLRLFQLYIDRYGVDTTQAPELALQWLVKYAASDNFNGLGHILGRLFDAFGMQLPDEIPLEPLLQQGVLNGYYTAFEDLKKYYPDSFKDALAQFRECGGVMSDDPKHATHSWLNLRRPEYLPEIFQDNPEVEIQDIWASDHADSLLHCAARSGYLDTVVELVSFGLDVNAVNQSGETPLLQASKAGHYEVCKFLMQQGATAGLSNNSGETPLHFLVYFDGDWVDSIAEIMVENGADLHAWIPPAQGTASGFGTPMNSAVMRNHVLSIETLLRLGADPHYSDGPGRGPSAFRTALAFNYPEVVELMAGASSRSIESDDSVAETLAITALAPCTRFEHLVAHGANHEKAMIDTLRILRRRGAIDIRDMDGDGTHTVLHYAVVAGYAGVVDYLLRTGSKEYIDVISAVKLQSPLEVAIKQNHQDVFQVLLKHGANIHLELADTWMGMSYLHACAFAGHRNLYFAKELLKRGAEVDKLDKMGRTAFCVAIIEGFFALADLLYEHGADKDYTYKGCTPLGRFLAIPGVSVSRIKYFMGLNPNHPAHAWICDHEFERTVFHCLAQAGSSLISECVETKITFQYLRTLYPTAEQLNTCDRLGFPPLMVAVAYGKEDLIIDMLNAGADPDLGPYTPLRLAMMRVQWVEDHFLAEGKHLGLRQKQTMERIVEILVSKGATAPTDPLTGRPQINLSCLNLRATDIGVALAGFAQAARSNPGDVYGQTGNFREAAQMVGQLHPTFGGFIKGLIPNGLSSKLGPMFQERASRTPTEGLLGGPGMTWQDHRDRFWEGKDRDKRPEYNEEEEEVRASSSNLLPPKPSAATTRRRQQRRGSSSVSPQQPLSRHSDIRPRNQPQLPPPESSSNSRGAVGNRRPPLPPSLPSFPPPSGRAAPQDSGSSDRRKDVVVGWRPPLAPAATEVEIPAVPPSQLPSHITRGGPSQPTSNPNTKASLSERLSSLPFSRRSASQPSRPTTITTTTTTTTTPPYLPPPPAPLPSPPLPPHQLLSTLRLTLLPILTSLIPSTADRTTQFHHLRTCLTTHLCSPNRLDLTYDPASPLGSSSVRELEIGLNKLLRGFYRVRMKLRVEFESSGGGATRTQLRILFDHEGGGDGMPRGGGDDGRDGWLRSEGADWRELEEVEAMMMFGGAEYW